MASITCASPNAVTRVCRALSNDNDVKLMPVANELIVSSGGDSDAYELFLSNDERFIRFVLALLGENVDCVITGHVVTRGATRQQNLAQFRRRLEGLIMQSHTNGITTIRRNDDGAALLAKMTQRSPSLPVTRPIPIRATNPFMIDWRTCE